MHHHHTCIRYAMGCAALDCPGYIKAIAEELGLEYPAPAKAE